MLQNHMNTHVLFTKDIYVCEEDGQYSVRTKVDIPLGKLVLLEHVVSGEYGFVQGSILGNDALFNTLYPRDLPHTTTEERQKAAREKMAKNVFIFNGQYVVTNLCNKFNHSCRPTCHMSTVDKPALSPDITVYVYGIWTIRAVKAGEELTIDYVNGQKDRHKAAMAHFGITCTTCTPEYLEVSEHRANVRRDLCEVFRKRNESFIYSTVDQYLYTKAAQDVITLHTLGVNGYFPCSLGMVMMLPALPDDNIKNAVERVEREVSTAVTRWRKKC